MAWWLDLRRVFRLRPNWRFHVCNNVQNNQICRCYRRKKWAKSKTWSQDVSIAYVLCLDSKGNTGLRLDTFVRYCTVVNCCWALGWSNKLQIFLKFSFANQTTFLLDRCECICDVTSQVHWFLCSQLDSSFVHSLLCVADIMIFRHNIIMA